ncbi:WAP four-disulfide core domain protein 5-like isoform X3 [Penaeus japonicus]|uniref:WAP four-disulfide core domain protein 5-like isoform X3 n=1 Tax=Penaeus japonicus TaxID=27405 RepID=UPI001C710922|nr:WAP four-disulfide core domain protein 5-like isoform X3 [Penaeus japonicus]
MNMNETLRNLFLVHEIGRKNKFSVAVLLASTAAVTVAISNKPPYLTTPDAGERKGTGNAVKFGICPPLELACSSSVVPIACSNDSKCPASEKCCFDPCRQRHVCQLPSPL